MGKKTDLVCTLERHGTAPTVGLYRFRTEVGRHTYPRQKIMLTTLSLLGEKLGEKSCSKFLLAVACDLNNPPIHQLKKIRIVGGGLRQHLKDMVNQTAIIINVTRRYSGAKHWWKLAQTY